MKNLAEAAGRKVVLAKFRAMPQPAHETFVQSQEIELPASAPDSFPNFQMVVRPMFDLVRIRPDEPFFASALVTFLPDLVLSRAVNAAVRFERTPRVVARSGIDDILVLVYLSGSFSYEIDGETRVVKANEIAFFDLKLPFSIETQYVENISLALSRRRLADLFPALDSIHGYVLTQGATRDLLLAHLHACDAFASRAYASEAFAISSITFQCVAAGLQSCRRQAADAGQQPVAASLTDLTKFVESRLGDAALGPEVLTREFGLSRASLYRLFEPHGGVAAYILERRLDRALRAMTSAQRQHVRLKQLAHDLGFAHQSSFTRAFKKRFSVTPQEVRSLRSHPDEIETAAWLNARRTFALSME